MSATNQTTNYDLPLFIGTDKPSWLGDFNGAMNAIDTAIKGRADDISSLQSRMTATETVANTASSNASTALTNASNAQNAANAAQSTADNAATAASGAQSTANTAVSNAATAQNTANTASNTATSALSLANSNSSAIAKLNLTVFENFDNTEVTSTAGSVGNETSISVATNSDGSVGKVYGRINITGLSLADNSTFTITIPQTKFRPAEAITINGIGLRNIYVGANFNDFSSQSINIATNGTITISCPCNAAITREDVNLISCLLFMSNFGDVA